jgi:hypothetical protein
MLMGIDDNIWPSDNVYADPMRLWAHAHTPRDLKNLFKWVEYLYYNSAQIFAGVKKFAEYPITEINYKTDNQRLKEKYQMVLEKVLGAKRACIKVSLDLQVYGNSFSSVQLPFKRNLVCEHCSSSHDIKYVDFKYDPNKVKFNGKCPNCEKSSVFEVKDTKIVDPKRIHIIRWDPKRMDISYNPITNEYEYFLELPEDLADRIKNGDRHICMTTPMSVLETVASDERFKFAPGEIWHMKSDAPAGVESGWGYPQLVACMPLFYHAAILRRANEAIALDRIVPKRIIHPAATSGNADPITTISVQKWMSDMEYSLKQWNRDPNHIMMAPVAVATSQISGDGRALLVSQEISQAEDSIIAAMGFPKEFIYGGLSFTGSSVTLRMLENQLETSVFQLNNFLQWVSNKVGQYLSWETIEVELGDFKMVDDVQQKQLMLQLWQGGVISKTSVAETFGIDLLSERDRMREEQLADMRLQKEVSIEQQKLQNSIAEQAKAQAQMGQVPAGLNYDQQMVIAQADQVAYQLSAMDENTRRSQLHSLQTEDYVMYSVVIQRLEQIQTEQNAQMKAQYQAQMQGQGGMAPPGAPPV